MIQYHRITKKKHEATAWTGDGAALYPGRWNPAKAPAVYVSPTRSLAAMEMLVHLDSSDLLLDYVTAWIDVPNDYVLEVTDFATLPADWHESPSPPDLREIGRRWIIDARHVALRVPGAVVSGELNLVLNPAHPTFAHLARGAFKKFAFDPRLK